MKKKRKIIITFSIAIFLVLFLFFVLSKKDKTEYVTVDLKKQKLVQTVNEVGTVRASKELNLNFMQTGRLNSLNVSIGDEVSEGQVLAELDYSSLLIKKEEVLASLNIASANKEKLVKGASLEEVRILEAQVSQAKLSYESAREDLEQSKNIINENLSQAEKNLNDLKSSSDKNPLSIKRAVDSAKLNLSNTKKTGVQNVNNSYNSLVSSLDYNLTVGKLALDAVKRIVEDENIKEVFSVKNFYYKDETNRDYNLSSSMVFELESDIANLRVNYEKGLANKTADNMSGFLGQVFKTLNNCFNALESSIVSSSFTQSSLDNFKSSVSSHTSLVNAAISSNLNSLSALNGAILNKDISFSNAQDAVYKAEVALSDAVSVAEDKLALLEISSNQQLILANSKLDSVSKSYEIYRLQLEKLKSPARREDFKLVQAQVDQAKSLLDAINKQIEENELRAPIKGRVVKINYEIGEQVLSNVNFIVLLTENDFEVELFVSESDISKIKIGNEAEISFDAFSSDDTVTGKVYFIEPAATSISDIIYYKTNVVFSEDELIKNNLTVKSGMTANVVITSNEKDNVFAAPFRAIIEKDDGRKIVRVLNGSKVSEVEVEVGMGGDQAMFEITSDNIKEGDKVITIIKNGN